MTTRRKFAGGILAAGALANFSLIAGKGNGGGNNGNPCNGHGKADQCHGQGAKKDTPTPPTPNPCRSGARMGQDNTPPPACKSKGGKEDHVE